MALETIRLSQQARDQLVTLKRRTGIAHWNVLCRWAFCRSLAEPAPPPAARIPTDSTVEMTWRTFAGEHRHVYWALLRHRCHADGLSLDDTTLAQQFRLHLHRGIGYLAGDTNLRDITDLVATTMEQGDADAA
ncbi:DNA sulfur modification protein DndE [Haloechinothrix halophila]|uniref:DNA sulfur modification protein DndE n=1 Tax=Haloechinothrix halophila TaxID=1069073 RepID=UPI000416E5B5|nr:DNA sulfur modification protein DndE [Haloechinothrix halophila]